MNTCYPIRSLQIASMVNGAHQVLRPNQETIQSAIDNTQHIEQLPHVTSGMTQVSEIYSFSL